MLSSQKRFITHTHTHTHTHTQINKGEEIPQNIFKRINQDGRVEGRALTPCCESTRITTGCWTIIDRKTLDFTKEDSPHPRTEEKPQ